MGNAICCSKDNGFSRGGSSAPKGINRNRNQTLTPNMKNFKSLRYVTDINQIYAQGTALGEGAFGAVKRCTRLNTNQEHAMKIIKKSSLN